jgi:hypothetical protein
VGAAWRPDLVAEARLRAVLALALAGTAFAHLLTYRSAEPGVLAIDLALLVTAALVWTRQAAPRERAVDAEPELQPAE